MPYRVSSKPIDRFFVMSSSFLCYDSTHYRSFSRFINTTKTLQKSLCLHSNNDSKSFNGRSIEVTIIAVKSATSCSSNRVLFCLEKFGGNWGKSGNFWGSGCGLWVCQWQLWILMVFVVPVLGFQFLNFSEFSIFVV